MEGVADLLRTRVLFADLMSVLSGADVRFLLCSLVLWWGGERLRGVEVERDFLVL